MTPGFDLMLTPGLKDKQYSSHASCTSSASSQHSTAEQMNEAALSCKPRAGLGALRQPLASLLGSSEESPGSVHNATNSQNNNLCELADCDLVLQWPCGSFLPHLLVSERTSFQYQKGREGSTWPPSCSGSFTKFWVTALVHKAENA